MASFLSVRHLEDPVAQHSMYVGQARFLTPRMETLVTTALVSETDTAGATVVCVVP